MPDASHPNRRTVGPYRLEAMLGRGGMGEVYRAYDERLDRRVAIKHVRAELGAQSAARERFRREARAAARLSHPSIVPVFDLLETDDGDWIVMELVDGHSVADLLARGPVVRARALRWARQVAEGLAEAHRHGIVHRDLKAENVMITRSDRARILDFGLAKPVVAGGDEHSLTLTGEVKGTARAMSPEQARGHRVDERSDLFSLGVLLYELLAGVSPFRGADLVETLTRLCTEQQAPLLEVVPGVDPELSQLVDRLLAKTPEQRPASADRVAQSLEVLAGEESTAVRDSVASSLHSDRAPHATDATDALTILGGAPTAGSVADKASASEEPREPNEATDSSGLPYRHAGWRQAARVGLLLAGLGLLVGGFVWWRAPDPSPESSGAVPESAASKHDAANAANSADFDALARDPRAAVQHARGLLARYDRESHVNDAIDLLRRATAEGGVDGTDATAAPAWALLAYGLLKRYQNHDRDTMWLQQARATADRAVAAEPQLALAGRVDAYVAIEERRFDAATESLDRVERLEPKAGETAFLRGELAHRRGNLEAAEAHYREALDRGWLDRQVHDALGAVYYLTGHLDAAEDAFRRSLEIAPDVALGYRNLAAVDAARGNWADAAARLQQALEIEPSPTLYSSLGTVLYYQGFYEDSAAAFERALEQGGSHHHSQWGDLGDAYSQVAGEQASQRALEAYRRALQLTESQSPQGVEPDDPLLDASRALYAAKLGRDETARTLLDALATGERADEVLRNDIALHLMIRTAEALGARQRALDLLARAADLDALRAEIELDPELTTLRADLAYHRLLAAPSTPP